MAKQSHIEQLIHNLCPNGVEYKMLGEVTYWDKQFNGVDKALQPQTRKYHYYLANELENLESDTGTIRILYTNSRVAYTDEQLVRENMSDAEVVCIPWGGNANIKYYKGKFVTADNRIAVVRDSKQLSTKFVYYWLVYNQDDIETFYRGAGIKHPSMLQVLTLPIPLPPLQVQEEIVHILDTFGKLIDNIDAEIKERKRQFEIVLNACFETDIKKVKISDLGTITRGRRFVRTDIMEQGTPCIHYGDIYMRYPICVHEALTFLQGEITKKMRYAKNGDVVYVGAGENDEDIGMAIAWLGKEPAAVHDACYILSNHNQDAKYLAYMSHAKNFHQQLKMSVASGKICSIPPDGLGRVIIPLPSLKEQQAIAEKLDTIEAFIANLKEERDLRQKQYEYYRAKLISLLK